MQPALLRYPPAPLEQRLATSQADVAAPGQGTSPRGEQALGAVAREDGQRVSAELGARPRETPRGTRGAPGRGARNPLIISDLRPWLKKSEKK